MKRLGVTVIRCSEVDGAIVTDANGDLADYAGMMHFFKEALEHGFTLEEAIEACELENGK